MVEKSEEIIKVAADTAHINLKNMEIGKRYNLKFTENELVIFLHDKDTLHIFHK